MVVKISEKLLILQKPSHEFINQLCTGQYCGFNATIASMLHITNTNDMLLKFPVFSLKFL
jgi:hypothetical protein